MQKHLGKIHVVTSHGPHDRSAALGMALQSLGHGYKVFVVHVLQNASDRGEFKLQELVEPLDVVHFAPSEKSNLEDPTPEDIHFAHEVLDYLRRLFSSDDRPDVLILENINPVVHHGLLSAEEFCDFLDNKPQNIEIILTGAPVHPKVTQIADLITEITPIKGDHASRQGITH